MESSPNIKIISAIIIILLILGAGYLFLGKGENTREINPPVPEISDNQTSTNIVVENTPMVNGVLPVPKGLPPDLPLEGGEILESASTRYPDQEVQQLSVSYQSSKTLAQKYTEYKNYMTTSGYEVVENDVGSTAKILLGTKGETSLAIAVSSSEGQTLVQISYLFKPI